MMISKLSRLYAQARCGLPPYDKTPNTALKRLTSKSG